MGAFKCFSSGRPDEHDLGGFFTSSIMAKGNIGNLLQHFLALRAAECLLQCLNQPSVTYVDAFSMDAWESVEPSRSNAAFQTVIHRFDELAEHGDLVAKTFLRVWRDHYHPDAMPPDPRQRDYPNSAVLLQAAFPGVEWQMRLHQIDERKRERLTQWADSVPGGVCRVAGDWRDSSLIVGAAVRPEQAALVMLDPFKVVAEGSAEGGRVGMLSESQLRYMLGRHCLDLNITRRTVHSPPPL